MTSGIRSNLASPSALTINATSLDRNPLSFAETDWSDPFGMVNDNRYIVGAQAPNNDQIYYSPTVKELSYWRLGNLTIDVTEQQHQALKAMAALQGKTIKQYALERLFPRASEEEQALQDLQALLLQRLAEAQRGEVVDHSIMDVANEVLSGGGPA